MNVWYARVETGEKIKKDTRTLPWIWPDTFFLLGHPEIFINKFYIFKNYHFP
jgi:hypothetical protein